MSEPAKVSPQSTNNSKTQHAPSQAPEPKPSPQVKNATMKNPVLGRIIGVSIDTGVMNSKKKGLTRIMIGLGEAQGVKNGMRGRIVETGVEFVLDRGHGNPESPIAFSAVLKKNEGVEESRVYDEKTDRYYGRTVMILGSEK